MTATLLPHTALSGVWQMALDGALLQRRQPVLRFYRWRRPALSLGFHQRLQPAWLHWQAEGQGDLVRRPSGGGAVLHGGDLCYALVWPDPGCSRQQAYLTICSWLQQAFAELGEPLQFGAEAAGIPTDCFARSSAADLINANGHKRIGSAQRWQQGCLLQHGSIQLAPDSQAWPLLLGGPAPQLPQLPLSGSELSDHLIRCASRWLSLAPIEQPLGADLLAQAGSQLERYRIDAGSPIAA